MVALTKSGVSGHPKHVSNGTAPHNTSLDVLDQPFGTVSSNLEYDEVWFGPDPELAAASRLRRAVAEQTAVSPIAAGLSGLDDRDADLAQHHFTNGQVWLETGALRTYLLICTEEVASHEACFEYMCSIAYNLNPDNSVEGGIRVRALSLEHCLLRTVRGAVQTVGLQGR